MTIMWALRSLGKIKILRSIAIRLFSLVYRDGATVKIARGPLKGLFWRVNREHQFWMPLGVYETQTAGWLSENIGGGDTFFDIGANAGYFTLLACRFGAKVVAFDPVPSNVETIDFNLSCNQFNGARVEQIALSNRIGAAGLAHKPGQV